MKPHFCAIANQQAGEDLIGTAGHYQTYVLIECPMPWAAKVFNSESIPLPLRQYIKAVKAERSIQFLAINRGTSPSSEPFTVMVYERTVPSGTASSSTASSDRPPSDRPSSDALPAVHESITGYRGYEFSLTNLTQVVDCLKAHWQGDRIGQAITQQDILVCTHGMRDKCCARFGQPFFRDAVQSVKRGELPNTRVWKVSHIGGHRFAPTAISLPDGRYYGQLTLSKLQAVINRKGPINQIRSIYRGWGLLPAPLQVLEQQLMLKSGWAWFERKITYRILVDRKGKQGRELLVEITIDAQADQQASQQTSQKTSLLKNSHKTMTYRAKLQQDPQRTLCVKASCSSAVATPMIKYTVSDCVVVGSPRPVIQPATQSTTQPTGAAKTIAAL